MVRLIGSEGTFEFHKLLETEVSLTDGDFYIMQFTDLDLRNSGVQESLEQIDDEKFSQGCRHFLLFLGISEFPALELWPGFLVDLKRRVPKLLSRRKITLVVDSTSLLITPELKVILDRSGFRYYSFPSFKDLHWGTSHRRWVNRIVERNIRRYLQNPEKNLNKGFVRCRRPSPERWSLIQGILRDSQLSSNCIYTLNAMPLKDQGQYQESEIPAVAFNSTKPPYNQTWTDGASVHEYNFYGARKDLFFEIIAEHVCYITEKTYKPMLLALPCLYLGPKGMIEELHRQGFWTFNRWWDESYDELDVSDPEKLQRFLEQAKILVQKPARELEKMYIQMIPTFLHNAKVLSQKSPELQKIEKLFFKDNISKDLI